MIRIVAIFVVMYLARIPAYAQVLGEATFTAADDKDGADILGAFTDSLKLLMIEHGSRVAFQEKTRRELSGSDSDPMGGFGRVVGELHRSPDSWCRSRVHLARSRTGSSVRNQFSWPVLGVSCAGHRVERHL
jgi:hypothetical protein